MKITFNSLGQVVGAIDFEGQTIRQGMTNVVLKAVFEGKQNINYNAKFNLTRSDSANITNVVMNLGSASNSYEYPLNDEWFFAKSGQTTVTFFLVDGNGEQIATGQVQFTVQANDYDEDPETITEAQYNALLAVISKKVGFKTKTVRVSELPEVGEEDTVYFLGYSDRNLVEAYIYDVANGEYQYLGSNSIDLGNYYERADGEEFEREVDSRVTRVENELSSVASGSPKGVYATVEDLTLADPDHDYIYVVTQDGHWYYWNVSAWTDGGVYLVNPADTEVKDDSVNGVQNKAIAKVFNSSFKSSLFKRFEISKETSKLLTGFVKANGTIDNSTGWLRTTYIELKENDFIKYKGVSNTNINCVAFFNENKVFISGVIASASSTTEMQEGYIAIPNNAKYAIFCFSNQSYVYDNNQNYIIYNTKIGNILTGEELKSLSQKEIVSFFESAIHTKRYTYSNGDYGYNGWIKPDGTTQAATSGWKASLFIPINEKCRISYLLPNLPNVSAISFYDYKGVFISSIIGLENNAGSKQPLTGEIMPPSGSRYIRYTFSANDYWFETSQYVLICDPETEKDTDGDILFAQRYENIASMPGGTTGWLNSTGGVSDTSTPGFTTSEFVNIEYVKEIEFSLYPIINQNVLAVMICFYDENKQFISTPIDYSNNYTGVWYGRVQKPSGAKYVRFTFGTAYEASSFVNLKFSIQELLKAVQNVEEAKVGQNYNYNFKAMPRNYKKINLIGDSITQGSSCTTDFDDCYASILRKMLSIEFGGKLNYGFISAYTDKTELLITNTMLIKDSLGDWARYWNGTEGYGNDQLTSSTVGSEYVMHFAKQFNYLKLAYVKGYTGVAVVFAKVNSELVTLLTIDSTNATKEPAMTEAIDISEYPAGTQFGIYVQSGTFSFTGWEVGMNEDWVTFNNYGRAGASIQMTEGTLLDKETDCDLLIYALGTNNSPSEITTYLNQVKDTIKAKTCNKLVFCTCWKSSQLDRLQNIDALKSFAKYIGADFLAGYDVLPKDEETNVDPKYVLSSVLAQDGVHPNDIGHEILADALASKLELSCKSKDLEEMLYEQFELHY